MISHILAEQILILFMIMAVGFIARRANIIRVEMTKGLSDLLLNITLPFLIITSFNSRFSQTLLVNGGVVLASTFAVHFVSYVLGKLLFSVILPVTERYCSSQPYFRIAVLWEFPSSKASSGNWGFSTAQSI